MRFREQSQIGWLMAQLVGAKSLPVVTREAVQKETGKERLAVLFRGRAGGKALDTFRSVDSGRYTDTLAAALPGESLVARAKRLIAKRNMAVIDGERVSSFSTTESLWWLSYADDHRCAGVAIVRVAGEQSAEHAADVARGLGLTPEGEWQVAAVQVPEEECALAEACVGRLLSTAEAEQVFAAKSIKNHEAETGLECDWEAAGVQVVEP